MRVVCLDEGRVAQWVSESPHGSRHHVCFTKGSATIQIAHLLAPHMWIGYGPLILKRIFNFESPKVLCTLRMVLRSDEREHGVRGFRAGQTRLSTTPDDHADTDSSKLLLADLCVAILYKFLVGPLLTTSRCWPGESCQLRSELAEGNSLDEALIARASSLLCSAPGKSLDPIDELSIKLAQRTLLKSPKLMLLETRGRLGEVPRSLPLVDLSLPWFHCRTSLKRTGCVTACTRCAFHSAGYCGQNEMWLLLWKLDSMSCVWLFGSLVSFDG